MNILRINMTDGKYELNDIYKNLWGRRLIAEVLVNEVPPHCHPLGSKNKLIIAAGPLAGVGLSSTSRISVGGKSPLTGGAKEANSGGTAVDALVKWGIRAVIVEGMTDCEDSYILRIGNNIALEKRSDLRNTGTYELCKRLNDEIGSGISIICIGPAGEQRLTGAGVAVTDREGLPGRFAGRGGLGAVMGSKGLKAIVIETRKETAVAICAKEKFAKLRNQWHETLQQFPHTGQVMAQQGTLHMFTNVQALGGIPVRNYRYGRVENGEQLVSANALRQLIKERGGKGKMSHSCMTGCIVRCSNVVPDENGEYLVSPLEYETVMMLGTNLCITLLSEIAKTNYLCNDLGLDTVETGGALGVAMEAGLLPFGDVSGVISILEKVRTGDTLGRVIGCGVETTAKVFGVKRAPQSKGQGFPAYDPRAVKGLGVTYATSPMGADHTAGMTVAAPIDHHSAVGQTEVSKQRQIRSAAFDAAGICAFLQGVIAPQPEIVTSIWNAIHGTTLVPEDFYQIGQETIMKELAFNTAAGIPSSANRLPEFMEEEALEPFNLKFDVDSKSLANIFMPDRKN